MLVLKGNEHKCALSLDFTPQDRLHNFCNNLKTKLEKKDSYARHTAYTVVVTQPANDGGETDSSSFAVVGSQKLTCHYCQNLGHTAYRYYLKKRDIKRLMKASETTSKAVKLSNTP